jgi:hypothetical protein
MIPALKSLTRRLTREDYWRYLRPPLPGLSEDQTRMLTPTCSLLASTRNQSMEQAIFFVTRDYRRARHLRARHEIHKW